MTEMEAKKRVKFRKTHAFCLKGVKTKGAEEKQQHGNGNRVSMLALVDFSIQNGTTAMKQIKIFL